MTGLIMGSYSFSPHTDGDPALQAANDAVQRLYQDTSGVEMQARDARKKVYICSGLMWFTLITGAEFTKIDPVGIEFASGQTMNIVALLAIVNLYFVIEFKSLLRLRDQMSLALNRAVSTLTELSKEEMSFLRHRIGEAPSESPSEKLIKRVDEDLRMIRAGQTARRQKLMFEYLPALAGLFSSLVVFVVWGVGFFPSFDGVQFVLDLIGEAN